MAEAFGIGAGVVGVVSLTIQISQIVVQFGLDWRDAPANIQHFKTDLDCVKSVLSQVHTSILLNPEYAAAFAGRDSKVISELTPRSSATAPNNALQTCERTLRELHRKLEKSLQKFKKRGQSWERLESTFRAKNTREAVEDLHRQCQTFLAMIMIESAVLGASTHMVVKKASDKKNKQHSEKMEVASRVKDGLSRLQQMYEAETKLSSSMRIATEQLFKAQMVTSLAIKDEIHQVREFQESKESTERQKAILDWLTPIDFTARQHDTLNLRQAGTGQWLLDSAEMQKWVEGTKQTLFCEGIPGVGKTVLTSTVIEELSTRAQDDNSIGVAYIYFSYKRETEQKPEVLLASLLKQLAQCLPSLPERLACFHDKCNTKQKRRRPSFPELFEELQSILCLFSKVFIVMDAVDECKDTDGCRSKFIRHMFDLQKGSEVNIFATSRSMIEKFENSIFLRIRAKSIDVRRYLEDNIFLLSSCVQNDYELQEEVKDGIISASDGMFLLAYFHLHSLKDKTSTKAVRRALQMLATGEGAYEQVYADSMKRIRGQLDGHEDLAIKILSWITCATRPLRTRELQQALAVEVEEQEFDEDNITPIKDILSVCAGLVTIDQESDIIRLVHYTTQDYFTRTQREWFPNAGADISTICVKYLFFTVYKSGCWPTDNEFEERVRLDPLYDYATHNWGHHAREATVATEVVESFLKTHAQVKTSSQGLVAHVEVARQAVEAIAGDDPSRPAYLNNLAYQLESRYQQTGNMAELDDAIAVANLVLTAIQGLEEHPDRIAYLNNYGSKLGRRYQRTGDKSHFEEAIWVIRRSVDATHKLKDHPDRAACLTNLATCLGDRYQRSTRGDPDDLEAAIAAAREAKELAPVGHPGRATYLNNLGSSLASSYQRSKRVADLEEAIQMVHQAVNITAEDDPDRAVSLTSLGICFTSRYERNREIADLESASTFFQQAWNTRVATPFRRIEAATRCLNLLCRHQKKADLATQLGKDVIDLLPTVNHQSLDRRDQQYVISAFAGVAPDVCALLLASDQVEEALHYLEKGRTVMLNELIDGRSDTSSLERQHPEIALRYEKLRKEISVPLRVFEFGSVKDQTLSRRRRAVAELDACIEEIRSMAGYERFLLGQTTPEIRACAASGTIIVVNITDYRSDAILITSSVVTAINLPDISLDQAKACSAAMRHSRSYSESLAWLWRSCVKPILDQVHVLQKPKENDLLRVWWVGSGFASSLPFHAAGVHSVGSTETAYHRSIPSYIPSIKSLSYARNKATELEATYDSLLMVTAGGRNTGHGLAHLPFVHQEARVVLDFAEGKIPTKYMESPDDNQVIEELQHCSIAHFACHSVIDNKDPYSSRLLLDHSMLTTGQISEMNLEHARLAYLSTSSAAESNVAELLDEAIHPTTGFLAAGFPHVVGSVGLTSDEACVEIAREFYSNLFGRGKPLWGDSQVAIALREAVMKMMTASTSIARGNEEKSSAGFDNGFSLDYEVHAVYVYTDDDEDDEDTSPGRWAPFVHYGP